MSWEDNFVKEVAGVKLDNVFNPYSDFCNIHDLPDAAAIRRANLTAVLRARHEEHVESIWFGRDLGYRGGRRTGLALTDEVTMHGATGGSGSGNVVRKATQGLAVSERTAAVVWGVIGRLQYAPLLWNAFPLHPHEPGNALSNRSHSLRERRMTAWAIEALIDRFGGPRLIAIGNDASKALRDLGFNHDIARHPSYGGQREFVATMERLHSLAPSAPTLF